MQSNESDSIYFPKGIFISQTHNFYFSLATQHIKNKKMKYFNAASSELSLIEQKKRQWAKEKGISAIFFFYLFIHLFMDKKHNTLYR